MKHRRWLFTLLIGSIAIAEASCGSSSRSSRSEDDDDDGGSASSSSGEGGSSSSASGVGGVGGAGGSSGMCAQGGEPCVKFSDCCSGLCDNGVCPSCSGEGELCGQGCCEGLTCKDGTCTACKPLDTACSVAGDCCSKNCLFGACAPACTPVGSDCSQAIECCSGICIGGVCQSESCVTCSAYFSGSGGSMCPHSLALYKDFDSCVCPICGGVCTSFCDDGPPSPECKSCALAIGSSGGPCDFQYTACANDM